MLNDDETKGRASAEDLNTLHRKLTERMLALLESDKTLRGSTLKEIIAFLRDNDIKGAVKPKDGKQAKMEVPFA